VVKDGASYSELVIFIHVSKLFNFLFISIICNYSINPF
jgi:hypothetical protein